MVRPPPRPEACTSTRRRRRHRLTLDGRSNPAHLRRARETLSPDDAAALHSNNLLCLHALSSFQRTGFRSQPEQPYRLFHRFSPSERPVEAVLGEPCEVTTRSSGCQALFAADVIRARFRDLADPGRDSPHLVFRPRLPARRLPAASCNAATGMAPVRRTVQSYDWRFKLVKPPLASASPARFCGQKNLLRSSWSKWPLTSQRGVRSRRFSDPTDPRALCQPRSIRMRKFSFLPLRTRKSLPSIASSGCSRAFSSVTRRSFT